MYNNLTTALLQVVETNAAKYSGHYSIFKFSTNFKGFYGTPEGDTLRKVLELSKGFGSLNDLLYAMADNPKEFSIYTKEDIANCKVESLDKIRAKFSDDFQVNGHNPF
jgi:hypothetical protein